MYNNEGFIGLLPFRFEGGHEGLGSPFEPQQYAYTLRLWMKLVKNQQFSGWLCDCLKFFENHSCIPQPGL